MSVDLEANGPLTIDEARELTDQARTDARTLWREMARLYYGGAHIALGYSSWGEYGAAEFDIGERTAKDWLDAGRVQDAIGSGGAAAPPMGQKVALALAPLLPPTNEQSARAGRSGSDEQVAEAWATVVEAAEEEGEEITAPFARKVLVKAGLLPDTATSSRGPGNWNELIGKVGDDLQKAGKDMDRFERNLGDKQPTKKVVEKANRYAGWADDLTSRLRGVGHES